MDRLARSIKTISLCMLLWQLNACKKDEPVAMSTLISYTSLPQSDFDRIDVIVDGEVKGTITKPTSNKPVCWAKNSESVSSISLPAGKHKVAAKHYLDGKLVGSWPEETTEIAADQCSKIKWAE